LSMSMKNKTCFTKYIYKIKHQLSIKIHLEAIKKVQPSISVSSYPITLARYTFLFTKETHYCWLIQLIITTTFHKTKPKLLVVLFLPKTTHLTLKPRSFLYFHGGKTESHLTQTRWTTLRRLWRWKTEQPTRPNRHFVQPAPDLTANLIGRRWVAI
jgi:hypothetical protein